MDASVEAKFLTIERMVVEEGLGYAEIGRRLGINRCQVYKAWTRHIKPARLLRGLSTPEQPHNEIDDHLLDLAVEVEREKMEVAQAKAETKAIVRKRIFEEDFLETLKECTDKLASRPIEAVAMPLFYPVAVPRAGVLLLSDSHMGQASPARLDGNYAYDSKIAALQWRRLTEQTIHLCAIYGISELYLIDLGDDVDGDDMRPGQHRLVDKLAVEQSVEYANHLARLLRIIAEMGIMVHVYRVPGNHARVSQGKGIAGLAELDPMASYDWLAGEIVRGICQDAIDDGAITFSNDGSIYGTIDIYGQRILFEHGCSLSGGTTVAGIPINSIIRAVQGYRDLEGHIDLYVHAHYHRFYTYTVPYSTLVIGNGAFPPTSPFILSTYKARTRPEQTFLIVDEERGIGPIIPIWLDVSRVRPE